MDYKAFGQPKLFYGFLFSGDKGDILLLLLFLSPFLFWNIDQLRTNSHSDDNQLRMIEKVMNPIGSLSTLIYGLSSL